MIRILLDEHISRRVIRAALEEDGHDVRVLSLEEIDSVISDDRLLAIATDEQRILVTADVNDFPRLVQLIWDEGNDHHGVILVPKTVRTNDFGTIIRGIRSLLDDYPQHEWINRVEWLRRVR